FDAWVSRRGSHRQEALGVYNGIVRMWREHRGELEALRTSLFPASGPGAASRPAMTAWTWMDEAVARRTNLHRTLWPFERPPASADEIEWVADQYRRRVVSDATCFYLKTDVEKDGPGWRLRAATSHPRLLAALRRVLERLECGPIQVEMTALPSDRLGRRRFGVTRMPMALVRSRPDEAAGADTQLLLGDRVFLLDETADGAYLLLHAADGYVGWVRADAVLRMEAAEFGEWERAPRATLLKDVLLDDFRLPAGARLPLIELGPQGAKLRLPAPVAATRGQAAAVTACSNLQIPPEASPGRSAALAAVEFLTTPYVFGGRSRLGLDCSGLTGIAYATVGLSLPRDARQQVMVGQLSALPWHLAGLEPGDLLFFCDETGRVSHTGVSLGGSRFIHASPPEVQVSSLDPADPLYSARWRERFALARRPLP
ncbi:MAG: C40 family peptidase, partial [Phycisphaerae bacterium]